MLDPTLLTLNPDAAVRICLGGCDKPFASRGKDNRICPRCAARNAGLSRREAGAHRTTVRSEDDVTCT
jgi:hypothetical protein